MTEERKRPSYKSLLAAVLPLAVAITDEHRTLLTLAANQLGAAKLAAQKRAAAAYKSNPEKYKARAKAQRRATTTERRNRYAKNVEHYREKGREYAKKRRESGAQKIYVATLKSNGQIQRYQARYKYAEFAEAAIALYALERELNTKGIQNV